MSDETKVCCAKCAVELTEAEQLKIAALNEKRPYCAKCLAAVVEMRLAAVSKGFRVGI
jgi:hypothetical protein